MVKPEKSIVFSSEPLLCMAELEKLSPFILNQLVYFIKLKKKKVKLPELSMLSFRTFPLIISSFWMSIPFAGETSAKIDERIG